MPTFENVVVSILDKKPDNVEIAGYNDQDIMLVKGVACEEGVNANGALFEAEDLERADRTLTGKPLKIRFINNNPTTHGYDKDTGEFDELVKAIGVVHHAYLGECQETGKAQIVFYAGVWQKYYPEIANRMRELHREGNLKFSVEASRDYEITPEGYRRCFNIVFHGLCVVANPAWEKAKSLMVAELLKGGNKKVEFEALYKEERAKNEVLIKDLESAEAKTKTVQGELDRAIADLTAAREELAERDGKLKTVTAERDKFKGIVEKAEREALGAERMAKLEKYGKVEQSVEELAELSKEEYLEVLEKMVEAFDPTEHADKKISGVPHDNVGGVKTDNRTKLLSLVEGLLK